MFEKEALEKIKEIVRPVIEKDNLEFVNIELKIECRRRVLKIFIDKENGVNVEDCAKISRIINSLSEIDDLITGSYYLEVSSPGLDRPLFGEPDYKKFEGRLVKIKTSRALDGQKNIIGYLRGCKEQNIILEEKHSGKIIEVGLDNIARAKLEPEFK